MCSRKPSARLSDAGHSICLENCLWSLSPLFKSLRTSNVSLALAYLHDTVNRLQQMHPEGVQIIAGDFNQVCLKTVLPKFVQYVRCSTRGNNTLDRIISPQKPDLGLSDHLSLLLFPAFTPLRRKNKPQNKNCQNLARRFNLPAAGLLLSHRLGCL